jgi:hypothetical protein
MNQQEIADVRRRLADLRTKLDAIDAALDETPDRTRANLHHIRNTLRELVTVLACPGTRHRTKPAPTVDDVLDDIAADLRLLAAKHTT